MYAHLSSTYVRWCTCVQQVWQHRFSSRFRFGFFMKTEFNDILARRTDAHFYFETTKMIDWFDNWQWLKIDKLCYSSWLRLCLWLWHYYAITRCITIWWSLFTISWHLCDCVKAFAASVPGCTRIELSSNFIVKISQLIKCTSAYDGLFWIIHQSSRCGMSRGRRWEHNGVKWWVQDHSCEVLHRGEFSRWYYPCPASSKVGTVIEQLQADRLAGVRRGQRLGTFKTLTMSAEFQSCKKYFSLGYILNTLH